MLVVDAVFNFVAALIYHALVGTPAGKVFIQIDAYNLVGSQKAIVDALSEGVGVNGITEVIDVRNLFRFLRCGGEANLSGGRELFENFTPC